MNLEVHALERVLNNFLRFNFLTQFGSFYALYLTTRFETLLLPSGKRSGPFEQEEISLFSALWLRKQKKQTNVQNLGG